ncbi:hypothetical protein D3C77_625800 [compost metagenome]
MKHYVIAGIGDGAQHRAFGHAGSSQQGQGLVAMAGKHNAVETLHARRAEEGYAAFVTLDPLDRTVQADALGKGPAQRRHIAA